MEPQFIGKIIAEKYRLDSLIKRSGAAELYSATHRLMDKPFAVKVMTGPNVSEADRERFFAIAKAESAAASPGLPEVIDFGTDSNGIDHCVYEAISGDTLGSVIEHDGQFPAHTVINIGRQITDALSSAHSAGLIHGDLSSDNILLSNNEDGSIAATIICLGSDNPMLGDLGSMEPRDLAYLAPELCSGADVGDERSDIYSVGVLLYEMLAGQPPFEGEKPTDVMLKHIEEMPAPLSAFRRDVPEGLEPIILKALAKDPEMRQASAAELSEELAALSLVEEKTSGAAASGGFWKTALMMLFGIGLLGAALIYATWTNRTDPVTTIQPDANGLPVQPLNPATGLDERNLASLPGAGMDVNSNVALPVDQLPGGDGYDPWANARSLQPPGGSVTIPPDSGSPFTMDPGCTMLPSGLVICPTIVPTRTPTPTPRPEDGANTNTATAPTRTPSPQPTPARTPTAEPRPTQSPTNRDDPK